MSLQEMLRVLLDRLEERMKDTSTAGVIKKLFSGRVRSYIRCLNIDYESAREEDFYDIQVFWLFAVYICFLIFSMCIMNTLQLDVKGCKNIYDSFRKYVEKEILNGDNQYDAGDE